MQLNTDGHDLTNADSVLIERVGDTYHVSKVYRKSDKLPQSDELNDDMVLYPIETVRERFKIK